MLTPDDITRIAKQTGVAEWIKPALPKEVLTSFARAIEQAAARGALQTALGICAAVMTDSMSKDGEAACEACIVAIRALMGEAP